MSTEASTHYCVGCAKEKPFKCVALVNFGYDDSEHFCCDCRQADHADCADADGPESEVAS